MTDYTAWALTINPKGDIAPHLDALLTFLRQRTAIPGAIKWVVEKEDDKSHLHAELFDKYRLAKGKVVSTIKRDMEKQFRHLPEFEEWNIAVVIKRSYKDGGGERADKDDGSNLSINWAQYVGKDAPPIEENWPDDADQHRAEHIPLAERRSEKEAWKQMENWEAKLCAHGLPRSTPDEVRQSVGILCFQLKVAKPPELHKLKAFCLYLYMYINEVGECPIKVGEELALAEYEERQAKKRKIDEHQAHVEQLGITMRLTEKHCPK